MRRKNHKSFNGSNNSALMEALEQRLMLAVNPVSGMSITADTTFNSGTFTLTAGITIDADNVSLLTLKKAEDGDGFVLRLMETEGRQVEVSITLPWLPISEAFETDLVERDTAGLPCDNHGVRVGIGPYAMKTVRIREAV